MSNPASNYQVRPHGAGSLIVTRPIVPAPLRKPDTAAVLTGPLLPHPSSPGPRSRKRSFPGPPPPAASRPGQPVPETSPGTACRNVGTGTVSGTIGTMATAPAYDNSVRIGYARVSTRTQDHQAQLDALAAAHCREIIVETASTRDDRPKLREALGKLQPGGALVIYKPRPGRPVHEGTAGAAGRPAARPRDQPAHPHRHLRRDPPPRRRHDRRQDAVHGRRDGRGDGTRPDPRAHPRRAARRRVPRPAWRPPRRRQRRRLWPSPAPGRPAASRSPPSPAI